MIELQKALLLLIGIPLVGCSVGHKTGLLLVCGGWMRIFSPMACLQRETTMLAVTMTVVKANLQMRSKIKNNGLFKKPLSLAVIILYAASAYRHKIIDLLGYFI